MFIFDNLAGLEKGRPNAAVCQMGKQFKNNVL
jgi:hypothetical protein